MKGFFVPPQRCRVQYRCQWECQRDLHLCPLPCAGDVPLSCALHAHQNQLCWCFQCNLSPYFGIVRSISSPVSSFSCAMAVALFLCRGVIRFGTFHASVDTPEVPRYLTTLGCKTSAISPLEYPFRAFPGHPGAERRPFPVPLYCVLGCFGHHVHPGLYPLECHQVYVIGTFVHHTFIMSHALPLSPCCSTAFKERRFHGFMP